MGTSGTGSGTTARRSRAQVRSGRDVYVAAFQQSNLEKARVSVRRCVYACNLPFHVATTPAWQEMMHDVSSLGVRWDGPSTESLRTRELVAERDSIERELEPIRRSWARYTRTAQAVISYNFKLITYHDSNFVFIV